MARWAFLAALGCIACGGGGDDGGTKSGGGAGGSGATATSGGGGSGGTSSGGTSSGGSGGTPIPSCNAGSAGVSPGFHVALTGSASGDGSLASPWDLKTALLQPSAVKAGDTIYVHGGVYGGGWVGKLSGADGAPITLRSYPGEWAVLDGAGSTEPTLQIYKQWAVYRDLEITNTTADRTTDRPSGVYVEAEHVKLVNLIVHDTGTGIICNSAGDTNAEYALELEVYGNILYDNGWDAADRSHGHHLYLQNRDGTKHVVDNVVFNAFGFGVHAYSDTDKYWTQGYELRGNVWFQNGAASAKAESASSPDSKLYDDCLVGHNGTHPAARVELRENYGFAKGPGERDVRLGYAAPNEDAKLVDNLIVGQTVFQPSWQSVEMSGNTFYGDLVGLDSASYPNNTYLSQKPTGAKIVIRPNQYQAGRAYVIVYNWDEADTVEVDPSAIVPNGVAFELRTVQDPFAAPVLSGTYAGGTLTVPMSGLPVAQPIGLPGAITDGEKTGKAFNVFLLQADCQ